MKFTATREQLLAPLASVLSVTKSGPIPVLNNVLLYAATLPMNYHRQRWRSRAQRRDRNQLQRARRNHRPSQEARRHHQGFACGCRDPLRAWRERQSHDQVRPQPLHLGDHVRGDIAYGYASEVERLKARVESLEWALGRIEKHASVLTTHGIETMARDALTKEG